MKKIFSISMLAIMTAIPAFADNITNESMCVVDVLNQSNNASTANINAMWLANDYICAAGTYFDVNTLECLTCPENSYCPRGVYNVESQTNGITSCPSAYALSDAGAGAESDCYRQCTINDVSHSATVSGGYHSDGTNMCEPLTCATGYRIKPGIDFGPLFKNINANSLMMAESVSVNASGNITNYTNNNDSLGLTQQDINTWAIRVDNFGVIKGEASCNSNLTTLTEETSVVEGKYLQANATNRYTQGTECWCRMTEYISNGSSQQQYTLNSYWFRIGTPGSCDGTCSQDCVDSVTFSQASNMVDFSTSIKRTLASCLANTINLNWYADSTSQTPLTVNAEAQQCTYDQPISVPTTNPTRPGYTFTGWTLRQ